MSWEALRCKYPSNVLCRHAQNLMLSHSHRAPDVVGEFQLVIQKDTSA